MSAKFLEGLGGKLAEQWIATLLTPAFVFWAGGAVALLQRFGWTSTSTWFNQQPEALQIFLLIGIFCLIVASAFVVQRFDFSVLRFLEGYWHPWLNPVRRWCINRQFAHSRTLNLNYQHIARELKQSQLTGPQESEFYVLQQLDPAELTPEQEVKLTNLTKLVQHRAEQQSKFAQLDWQLMHRPLFSQLMPTRLGNILRAAEQRPLERYGLDAIVCWSRLWLLLPDAVKKDLQEARADLNTAARVWLWSLLFIGWVALGAWWAAPIGILSALFAYYSWALDAARTYGELIEAAFDLHRHLLYQSLRWNLPADPEVERRVGKELTAYLWRG